MSYTDETANPGVLAQGWLESAQEESGFAVYAWTQYKRASVDGVLKRDHVEKLRMALLDTQTWRFRMEAAALCYEPGSWQQLGRLLALRVMRHVLDSGEWDEAAVCAELMSPEAMQAVAS